MSKHTTLEQYLSKRRGANSLKQTGDPGLKGRSQLIIHEQGLRSRQAWETNFWNSKQECLQELQKIKDSIHSQEMYIAKWMENYQGNVFFMVDLEYQKIKEELINFLDRGHLENKRKLKQNFKNYGARQLEDIERIRAKLASIRNRIEQLQQELQNNSSYKRGIIDVVGSDFEAQRDEILSNLVDALKRYEGTVYLKVDASRFNRMRDDAENMFCVQGSIIVKDIPVKTIVRTQSAARIGLNGMSNKLFTEAPVARQVSAKIPFRRQDGQTEAYGSSWCCPKPLTPVFVSNQYANQGSNYFETH